MGEVALFCRRPHETSHRNDDLSELTSRFNRSDSQKRTWTQTRQSIAEHDRAYEGLHLSLAILSGTFPGLDRFLTVDDLSAAITPDEIKAIVYGNVAENIKNEIAESMNELLKRFLEGFGANVEYMEQVEAQFPDLIRDISSEAFLDEMEGALGPTLTSNYTFATKVAMRTLRLSVEAFRQIRQLMESGKPDNLTPRKEDIDQFKSLTDRLLSYLPHGDELPDPVEDNRFRGEGMAQLALGFNRSALLMLVLVVACVVRFKIPLSSGHIERIEELLRDWAQEVMTQEAMLSRSDRWTGLEIQPRRSFVGDGQIS